MSIVEFYSTTQRRDHRYNARWVRTKGKELGDKSYGYCEGGLEKSVGEDCHCQGTRRVRPRYPNLVVILALFPKVDDGLWDLERPLEKSCKLELLDFEHPEGARISFVIMTLPFTECEQAREFSGTHLHMYLERPLNDIMDATFVSAHRRMMVSSTKWPLQTGTISLFGLRT